MKRILIAILIVLLLVAGVLFYLKQRKSRDFEPIIKERLGKLIHDASGGLYKLEIGNLEIDILKAKLILVNAHLIPDTVLYQSLEKQQKAPNDLFEVFIDKLALDEVDIASLTSNNNIKLNKLFIEAPTVKVWHKKQPYNIPKDSTKTLYQQISGDIKVIKVDTILLNNVSFTHYNKSKSNKTSHLQNVNFIFTGLLMDSSTQYDQSRFLFADDCRISLKDYTINTSDSLYKFSATDLEIRTRDKLMELKNISLKPRLKRADFYKHLKHQQDIFNIEVAKLDFENVEWWSLLGEEAFLATKMNISNGNIKVYNDKSVAPDLRSKLGKFPNQLLAKVPFNVTINTIGVSNIDVSYEELNPKSGETGTLRFDNIKGSITNITNDSALIKANKHCTIDVSAMFLKKTPLKATFVFDLAAVKRGDFTVTATMGNIEHEQLNEILKPLALVQLNSLNVKSLNVSIKGDNYRGTGTVKLIYDDLNITALKNDGDTLKKRGLLSFVANTFIIKKANPTKGEDVRIGTGGHEHEPNKSFFNLVWKTIFVGAANTVGYKVKK